jgi:rod shape-determining protein MreB
MLFKNLSQLWRPDIAIDLGTATTRVAVMRGNYQFVTPSSFGTVPALSKGVIVNVDAAAEALRPALHHLRQQGAIRPRALACAPTDVSAEEKEAVIEACYRAGTGAVSLMPEPVAAALGDGVDYQSPLSTVMLDIGEGVTDCALIREGRLIDAVACRVACADLRATARQCVRAWNGLRLSDAEVMRLIEDIGRRRFVVENTQPSLPLSVAIPNLARTGEWTIPAQIVQEALQSVAARMLLPLYTLLDANPGLRRELQETGIRLSGGGALIPGFAAYIERTIGLPVQVVRSPLGAVVQGARRLLPFADERYLWR